MQQVDSDIRAAIKQRLHDKKMTQAELAQQLGIKQPSVASVITGKRGHIPQSLLDILDTLDLEIVVRLKR